MKRFVGINPWRDWAGKRAQPKLFLPGRPRVQGNTPSEKINGEIRQSSHILILFYAAHKMHTTAQSFSQHFFIPFERSTTYVFLDSPFVYAAYSRGVLGSMNASQSECEVGSSPIAFNLYIPKRMVKSWRATKVTLGRANLLSMKLTFTGEGVSYLSNTMLLLLSDLDHAEGKEKVSSLVSPWSVWLPLVLSVDATTIKMAGVPWDMDMRALIGENMSMAVMATEKIWTLFPLIQSMKACIGNCFPGANATSQAFYTVQNEKEKEYTDCPISFRIGSS